MAEVKGIKNKTLDSIIEDRYGDFISSSDDDNDVVKREIFSDDEEGEDKDCDDDESTNDGFVQQYVAVENEDGDDDDDKENNNDNNKFSKTKLSWPKAIMHNNACICLTTPKLRFLDISNYLAAGSSLDSFLKTYLTKLQKIKFPYNYLDSYTKLKLPYFPTRDEFYDQLHKEECSEADYAASLTIWTENNMQIFGDYLKYYNIRDVKPACIWLMISGINLT